METKNICRLCLVSENEIIEFFSDEGNKLNITKILVQHFWFQINRDDNLPTGICRICWKYINDFHEFYKNIESIHKNYYDTFQFKNDIINTKIKSERIDYNNDSWSFNHSNVKLIEPIIEIKIENTSNEISNYLNKSSKAQENISKRTTKTKKITNTKLTKTINNMSPIKVSKEEQQSMAENLIMVNDSNFTNVTNQNIDNFEDLSNAIIENHEEDDKIDTNPIITAENYKIKEFYNLKCEICSLPHSTMFELRKHFMNAHNCKSGYVLCCNKKLFRRCQLLEHIFWHTNPDEFKCKHCNQIYANKTGLKIHMQCHATPEERKYICDICDSNFTLRYHLMRHFRKIHLTEVDRAFKCNQCNKSFKKKVLLQSHIRGVHELKNLNICPICAKVYKSKQQCQIHYLDEHVNVNKPKLKCYICDALLKNEKSLKYHMHRKHYEEPVACKLCDKISPNKHALQKHMIDVHTYRTYKCNVCDKEFKRQIRLKEHMATHSGHSYLYTCPYCTTSFNSDANMYAHRKKKHPIEWLADRQRRLGITN